MANQVARRSTSRRSACSVRHSGPGTGLNAPVLDRVGFDQLHVQSYAFIERAKSSSELAQRICCILLMRLQEWAQRRKRRRRAVACRRSDLFAAFGHGAPRQELVASLIEPRFSVNCEAKPTL
jgi:hypothetical protein